MTEPDHLQRNIEAEANDALMRGSRILTAFTVAAAGVVFLLSRWFPHMLPPAVFVALCGLLMMLLYMLTRSKEFKGVRAWVFLLTFTTAPTLFFGIAEATAPSGAMTYLYGPISTTYFLIVLLTGFLFEPLLSRVAGVVAGLAYFGAYLIARGRLGEVRYPHEMMEEMTAWHIHFIKSAVIAASGFLVGALATSARRLVARSAAEMREREKMSQLFGEYVSDAVRDKLLRQLEDARGERTRVAILFSDLRGFTTFSEKLTPQELVERLNEYFDVMVGAIRRNGGRVDKFIGDAVMAVFGGLMPLVNPSESAVAAAIDMRRALAELNARWKVQGRTPIDNGIGIHVGEVLQGPIGSKDRKEFAVIGDVVNTASRLESATKELGQAIVVSSDVYAELLPPRQAGAIDLGEVKLKGKENAVRVWGIKGP